MMTDGESPLLLPMNEHKQLVVIDFEYANANVPGHEFANHFVSLSLQSFVVANTVSPFRPSGAIIITIWKDRLLAMCHGIPQGLNKLISLVRISRISLHFHQRQTLFHTGSQGRHRFTRQRLRIHLPRLCSQLQLLILCHHLF